MAWHQCQPLADGWWNVFSQSRGEGGHVLLATLFLYRDDMSDLSGVELELATNEQIIELLETRFDSVVLLCTKKHDENQDSIQVFSSGGVCSVLGLITAAQHATLERLNELRIEGIGDGEDT